jgi:hypothetical protein
MPTPVEFMRQYRDLRVNAAVDDAATMTCRVGTHSVQLRQYFMMNWAAGTEQRNDFNAVTAGPRHDAWFRENRERILTAAMGKGAPQDYALALEWAVRSNKVPAVTQPALQAFCDAHLGIDCSGFVTNYLAACGKRSDTSNTVRNTSAASYYSPTAAVNDPSQVRAGDLLVWMDGNAVKTNPGHVAVVESYVPQSLAGGNMRVVEATGAPGANPKLLDSMYTVERIVPRGGPVPAMILVVKRHGVSGSRVAVMRV